MNNPSPCQRRCAGGPAGFLVLVAGVVTATPAQGYVCSRALDSQGNELGPSLSWFTRDLTYTLQADGTAQISGLREHQVFRDAFAVWQTLQLQDDGTNCSSIDEGTDLTFTETAPSQSTAVGFNFLSNAHNENLLLFRDDGWPHTGPKQSLIVALTTTTYSAVTGEILDADIEFNSANYTFSATDVPPSGRHDLLNTAVHEVGHFLGLGHTVLNSAQGIETEATEGQTTMYLETQIGEVKKRSLHCNDAQAIVFKYPANADNRYCDPDELACGGCAPPHSLKNVPSVSVTGSDDGMGGCRQASNTAWWAMLVWAVTLATVSKARSLHRKCV